MVENKQSKNIPSKIVYNGDPIKYYREHFPHLTRGRLPKAFYEYLRRRGLIEHIPRATKYGKDPIEYYRENFPHLTRGQLPKAFYEYLRRRELLEHIPRATKYGKDPIEYYRENFPHLSRGQLQTNGHGGLYNALKRAGQLEHVPLKRENEKLKQIIEREHMDINSN